MGIDTFVEKGFEYLFEPPASQEEIALKALVDDFARGQESITTEMGKAVKVNPYSRAKGSFQKSGGLRFFANIFLLVCRMVTIFLLTQRPKLGAPFRYLEDVHKVHKKFSRDL